MARPEKVAVVEEIKEKLESAGAVFVTEYRGLTVGQQQELRRSLKKAEAEYKVFKMSLARRAAEESGLDGLLVWLEGPTAIAFSGGDPVPTAKSLKEFADSNENLVVKGGLLAGTILDSDAVRRLADLESREVLLAKLAGALSAPMSKLAGLMNAILRQPVTAMQQLLEKKESESPVEETPVASPESPAEEDSAAEEAPAEESAAEAETAEEPAAEEPAEEPAAEADTAEEPAEEPAEEAAAEEPEAEAAAEEPVAEGPAEEPEAEAAAEEPVAEEPGEEPAEEAAAEDDSEDSEDK